MKWRRIVFLSMWILSLIGISFFGGPISYGLFWGLTLLPVVSLVYLLFVFSQFRIYQEIGSRTIVCKQPMPYYFALRNETFFTFAGLRVKMFEGLSKVLDVEEDKEYQLLPDEKYVYETKLLCYYRGEYEVGVKEIVLTDFLRLFRFKYKNPGTIKAIVYPRLLHLKSIKGLEDELNSMSREYPFEQSQPDILTRDYLAGDSLKQIHFKASAKEMKLKTRLMWGERQNQVKLLIDTSRFEKEPEKYLPLENQILETALAIGEFMAGQGIVYSVCLGSRRVRVDGIGQFDAFYQEAAGIEFTENNHWKELLQRECTGADAQGQICVVVTSKLSEEEFRCLQMSQSVGARVLLYLLSEEDFAKWSNDRFHILQIPVEGRLEELL